MVSVISKIDSIKKSISLGDFEFAINDLGTLIEKIDFIRPDSLKQIKTNYVLVSSQYFIDKKTYLSNKISHKDFLQNQAKQIVSFLAILDTIQDTAQNVTQEEPLGKPLNEKIGFGFWNEQLIEVESPFARNYSNLYQEFPIFPKPNESESLLHHILNRLLSKKDNKFQIWIDEGDEDEFGKIYTNTSVLFFLIQAGFNLDHPECESAISYLDTIEEISINKRAKYYFDIQTYRIKKNIALKFLEILRGAQIINSSPYNGGFRPFRQGSRGSEDSPNKLPTHYGGFTFHVCLIADVILHMDTSSQSVKKKAIEILTGIRTFLIKMSNENGGYLVDGNSDKSPQFTTWFYALSSGLKIDLPNNWEEVLMEIMKNQEKNMFKASLSVMNFSLLHMRLKHKMKPNTIHTIQSFFDLYFDDLKNLIESNKEISCRDLALYGRSILYINKALGNDLFQLRMSTF